MQSHTFDYYTALASGAEQDILLLRKSQVAGDLVAYLSGLDGDFTASGVTLEEDVCSGDDLTFGAVPAGSMSFELINDGNVYTDFPWGRYTAFAAVKTNERSFSTKLNLTAYAEIGTTRIYGMSNGDVIVSVLQSGTPPVRVETTFSTGNKPVVGLIADQMNTVCPAVLTVSYDAATNTGSCGWLYLLSTPEWNAGAPSDLLNRKMCEKYKSGVNVSFQYDDAENSPEAVYYTWTRFDVAKAKAYVYELAYLGQYVIRKPESLQDNVIAFSDVHNVLYELDEDATVVRSWLSTPKSIDDLSEIIATRLSLDYTGIYDYPGFTTDTVNASTFGERISYTLREVLGFCAEYFGCMAVLRPFRNETPSEASLGSLAFVPVCKDKSDSVETIPYNNIVAGSLCVKEFDTGLIKEMQVLASDGKKSTYTVDSNGEQTYQINASPITLNPLNGNIRVGDTTYRLGFDGFSFRPASFSVIQADPGIELGDMITVKVSEDDTESEVDVWGKATGQTVNIDPVVMPLMHRTLIWQGRWSAEYQSTGSVKRETDADKGVYAASTAMSYTDARVSPVASSVDSLGTIVSGLTDTDTYTPTYYANSYVDATAVGRISIEKSGKCGILHLNLNLTSTLPSNATWVKIAEFSRAFPRKVYADISAQAGGYTLLVELDTTGELWIYNDSGGNISGWCRAEIPLIFT